MAAVILRSVARPGLAARVLAGRQPLLAACRRLSGGINEEFLETRPGVRAKIVQGARIADSVKAEVASEVQAMVEAGKRPPNLVVVIVGDDPASIKYVANKTKAAKKCGVDSDTIVKPASISQDDLLALVDQLNRDDTVDGILLQLPLPPHISKSTICEAVRPDKDVDAFHTTNIGKYCVGLPTFIPATPLGVLEIIKRCNIPTFGKNVCIVNRTEHIGFPLATILQRDGTGDATTLLCHVHTPPDQLRVMTQLADIIIVGTGNPGLIQADMVKEGAAVIDFGLKLVGGKQKGDVDFDGVSQVASILTPTPGGVGPLTVAMVIRNTLYAAQKEYKFDFKSIRE